MGRPRVMANGFTPKEAAGVTGLSVDMLNYLARQGYLAPAYGSGGRGRTRYYSYRDLVVARIIARLLDAGLEISRLKEGITRLSSGRELATGDAVSELRMLATDGRSLFFVDHDGEVRDLTRGGQLAFAFVLDVGLVRDEVVGGIPEDRRSGFSLAKRRLRPAA